MGCGITNLGSCLVEGFFEFVNELLNAPVKPLLTLTHNLMTEPVNIQAFAEIWAIIISILSLFYGILLVITGFRFMLSGYSSEQREKAKRSLSNILIMMILVQASFVLYSIGLEISSSISSVIFNMIPNNFFLTESGSFSNLGLELILLIPYLFTLVSTVIFLAIRYFCVSAGVVFFAIGIFFYFIDSLKSYGKLIINYLAVLATLPIFYSIILLTGSKFLTLSTFSDMKIIVMIGSFAILNIFTIILLVLVVFKAANTLSAPISNVTKITKLI